MSFSHLKLFIQFSPIQKHRLPNFDISFKKVKVGLGSSFKPTMMGSNPQCYMPSNKICGPLVLETKISKVFDMDVAAILVLSPRYPKEYSIFVLPFHGFCTCNLALI